MKKLLFLVMLTLTTAVTATSQIVMVSDNYNTAGQDTLTNAETIYFTTPVNQLNAATSGKYTVTLTETYISGTTTARNYVIEGTIDGTNWFKMHGTRGTDGAACDTIASTSFSSGSRTWKWTLVPGMTKYLSSTAYSVPTTEASNTGRVARIRVRAVGVTNPQSTKINYVRCLVQN